MQGCELTFSVERMITGLMFPSVVAVLAWILTNWIFGPILEAYKIRKEIIENLFYYSIYIPPTSEPKLPEQKLEEWHNEWDGVQTEIRRLASRLYAQAFILHRFHKAIISRFHKIDFEEAAVELLGVSATSNLVSRAIRIAAVEKSLNVKVGGLFYNINFAKKISESIKKRTHSAEKP